MYHIVCESSGRRVCPLSKDRTSDIQTWSIWMELNHFHRPTWWISLCLIQQAKLTSENLCLLTKYLLWEVKCRRPSRRQIARFRRQSVFRVTYQILGQYINIHHALSLPHPGLPIFHNLSSRRKRQYKLLQAVLNWTGNWTVCFIVSVLQSVTTSNTSFSSVLLIQRKFRPFFM